MAVTLSEHAVARAMLILEGWCTPLHIGREMGLYHRYVIAHWLKKLRANGRVERRRRCPGSGYEWRLTPAGTAFAIAAAPAGDGATAAIRWNHRALAQALGMSHTIIPSGDLLRGAHITVHICEGGR